MDDKTTHAALAFGATALLLSAVNNKSLIPPAQPAPAPTPAPRTNDFSAQSQTSEDANYLIGFFVGAAAVGAAWYVFNQAKPRVHQFTAPVSY